MRTDLTSTLEFPALLYGPSSAIVRKGRREGRRYAEHYLKHGTFPLPTQMREVLPGEVVFTEPFADFSREAPAWRLHLFLEVISGFDDTVGMQEWRRLRPLLEATCRETPWGALYHAVQPSAPQSAERMAARLAAVLRFWDLLSLARYRHIELEVDYTLEQLMQLRYGRTFEAWCPKISGSVREHMEATVERMARATREDCLQAVLRLVPYILTGPFKLKHREVLGDPAFLPERFATLAPELFDELSSAYPSPVYAQVRSWDKDLDIH